MDKKTLCPICKYKKYKYEYYYGKICGAYEIVEQHGYCERCGYVIEQAYSSVIEGFMPPRKRGRKLADGTYLPSNKRKRKHLKRKYNIKYFNNNFFV